MRSYLDAYDAAPWPVPSRADAPLVLAALGPRMLALAATVVLLAWPGAPRWGASVGIFAAISAEIAISMNAFGLDGRAADRYRLLPLSGRDVLLSKNAAFFVLCGIEILPIAAA